MKRNGIGVASALTALTALTALLLAGAASAVPCQAHAPPADAAPIVSVPASASAPSRGGVPRPYRVPIEVPSAAGQIRSPNLSAPTVRITPAAPPTFTGNCDSAGCWGSDGTRYNAIGGALVRPDGRMCQNVGGVMQCP